MLIAIIVSLSFLAITVVFPLADGDFSLLTARPAKREEIEGKVVWITGATKGIGQVLAKYCASLGAKLIISARNASELERVKAEILGQYSSSEVEILPLDLTSGEESLREVVQKAESFFSCAGVDYMVHNAGLIPYDISALNITEQSLLDTFNTNVLGPIALTRLLAPYMIKRGSGHFVVMSSAAAKVPAPCQAGYAASKFALNGYFHTLRSEIYQKGVKVTVICSGPIGIPKGAGYDASLPALPPERCVRLILTAATRGLKEVWMAKQPVLFLAYLMQYTPTFGFWLLDKMGADIVKESVQKVEAALSKDKKVT